MRDSMRYCRDLAKSHYENFTVGSLLLPVKFREPFAVIYSFCRHTDDLGDEAPGDRTALLNLWTQAIEATWEGKPPEHPVLLALAHVLKDFPLDKQLFLDLTEANLRDQTQTRWQDRKALRDYCRFSANPVGRMVLGLFGISEEEHLALSDHICTGLQLANHWQDVARDMKGQNRVYLPVDDMEKHGVTEDDLRQPRANDAFKALLKEEVEWARCFFRDGTGLLEKLSGRMRFDIGLFARGGIAILDAIELQDYDVLAKRPRVKGSDKFAIFLRSLPLLVGPPK